MAAGRFNRCGGNVSLGNDVLVGGVVVSIHYEYIVVLSDILVAGDIVVLQGAHAVNGHGRSANIGNLAKCNRAAHDGVNLAVAVVVDQLDGASNIVLYSLAVVLRHIGQSSQSGNNVSAKCIDFSVLGSNFQLVGRAVQLDLSVGILAVKLELANIAGCYNGRILVSVNAVNLVGLAFLVHNNDALANQVRVVVCNAGEVLAGGGQRVGVAVSFLLGAVQNDFNISILAVEYQIKVLRADGLLVVNVGRRLEVADVIRVNNALHVQRIVHDLRSVLTRQASVYVGINIFEQVVQVGILHGVSHPGQTGQTSLVCIVASNNQQHLGSLNARYGLVRSEAGRRLTSDDTAVLQVLDVTLVPVVGQIGERSGQIFVGGSIIVAAIEDGKDHLRHLSTGDGYVRTEGAIGVALDYAQTRQCVYGLSRLDVCLIRERSTSKHGERASERQYQCENLFQILHGVFPPLNFLSSLLFTQIIIPQLWGWVKRRGENVTWV